ncbi:MAG: energy-coupling factor ABC transporter permease, partial [Ilumatobacteraceae bacterium]
MYCERFARGRLSQYGASRGRNGWKETSMIAMHAPDGFLEAPVALATAVIALVFVALALRVSGRELGDRQVPLAGIAAAFIF